MPTKIFVGNLSDDSKSEDLQALFEKFGKVVECDILRNFGFVHMKEQEDAQAAIEALNGYSFDGFKMNVEISHSRGSGRGRGGGPMRRGMGGGYRGGRGRGGGPDPYDRPPRDRYDPHDRYPPPPPDLYELYERRLAALSYDRRLPPALPRDYRGRDPYARPPPDYYRHSSETDRYYDRLYDLRRYDDLLDLYYGPMTPNDPGLPRRPPPPRDGPFDDVSNSRFHAEKQFGDDRAHSRFQSGRDDFRNDGSMPGFNSGLDKYGDQGLNPGHGKYGDQGYNSGYDQLGDQGFNSGHNQFGEGSSQGFNSGRSHGQFGESGDLYGNNFTSSAGMDATTKYEQEQIQDFTADTFFNEPRTAFGTSESSKKEQLASVMMGLADSLKSNTGSMAGQSSDSGNFRHRMSMKPGGMGYATYDPYDQYGGGSDKLFNAYSS